MWTGWCGADDRVTDNREDRDDDNTDHVRQCRPRRGRPRRAAFDGAAFDGGAFDGAKAEAFGGRIMSILTGSLLNSMVDIGHRTGLFAAAAEGPATSEQLAARAGLCERYVREWLGAVTTGGIIEYDETTGAFFLPPEHAALLTTPAGSARWR